VQLKFDVFWFKRKLNNTWKKRDKLLLKKGNFHGMTVLRLRQGCWWCWRWQSWFGVEVRWWWLGDEVEVVWWWGVEMWWCLIWRRRGVVNAMYGWWLVCCSSRMFPSVKTLLLLSFPKSSPTVTQSDHKCRLFAYTRSFRRSPSS
jgi:hypothetical protein